jgi:hypothetical protein
MPLCSLHAGEVTKGEFGAARDSADIPKAKKYAGEKSYPFHGTIASVDLQKQTIFLEGKAKKRPILVTPSTKITIDGRAGALSSLTPGQEAGGSVFKNPEGLEEARTVRVGNAKVVTKQERKKDQ